MPSQSHVIVLEGPDCAGKSTLASALSQRLGARVVGNGPPPPDGSLLVHYAAQITAIEADGITVFDRLHVGEAVYGPELRGRSRLSGRDLDALEVQLDEAHALRIHVDASDTTLLQRHAGRGDELVDDPVRLLRIAAHYRLLLSGRPGWLTWRSDDGAPPPA